MNFQKGNELKIVIKTFFEKIPKNTGYSMKFGTFGLCSNLVKNVYIETII